MPSEDTFKKEVRTSLEETFKTSQGSRQAETTSTRPEVIDDTRQRQHRQDHEDGHRYSTGHVPHSTGHVPTKYSRPVTIHQKKPPRLHLTEKRRTTFNVQALCKRSFFSSDYGWYRNRGRTRIDVSPVSPTHINKDQGTSLLHREDTGLWSVNQEPGNLTPTSRRYWTM